MRESFLSNCEKSFVQRTISEGHRLDGRNYNESRNVDIAFGSQYGSCIVSLGETKVLAQISCEVVQPKATRPNEGILYMNVELGPMAAPQFEANRQTDLSVYLNRLLEKCYKDSKCIDLETLCIVAEEKVWSLRVDIKVLNHAGNLIECASVAALTALAHFKRPDVTRNGDAVTIHNMAERDPIPTVLYHYPVCLTFAIFNNDILVSDPSLIEESVCTSSTDEGLNTGGRLLVIGMNQYKELCLLDLTGAAVYSPNLVHKAILSAATRSKDVVDMIKNCIVTDDTKRQKRVKINFSDVITSEHVLSLSRRDVSIRLKHYNVDQHQDQDQDQNQHQQHLDDGDEDMRDDAEEVELSKYDVVSSVPQTAEVVSNSGSRWVEISSESEEDCTILN